MEDWLSPEHREALEQLRDENYSVMSEGRELISTCLRELPAGPQAYAPTLGQLVTLGEQGFFQVTGPDCLADALLGAIELGCRYETVEELLAAFDATPPPARPEALERARELLPFMTTRVVRINDAFELASEAELDQMREWWHRPDITGPEVHADCLGGWRVASRVPTIEALEAGLVLLAWIEARSFPS